VILDGWKLIHDLEDDSRELYHLAADPEERRNLYEDPGSAAARTRLEAELARLSGSPAAKSHSLELDPAEREMLHRLGYAEEEGALKGSGPAPPAPAPD
jgi:arylsulfatase A-like enzyme